MQELLSKRIGVLMGGRSSEREVSLKSGKAVAGALKRKGFDVVEIDVGDDLFERLKGIDVAFVVLHGKPGEDGVVQGILEFMGIPYTGAGVLGSALGMNKLVTKKVLEFHGVRTPPFKVLRRDGKALPGEDTLSGLDFPVVVKPVEEGSTIGVSVVYDKGEFDEAVNRAFEYGDEVLVEKFIAGRELTVGVVNELVLPVIEIRPRKGFYDYESKYTKGLTEYLVPAPIDEEIAEKAKEWALITHRALYQRGVSRTDFRMDESGNLYVLEVNSIPGMTETSLLPKAAKVAGLDFDDLVVEILKSAFV